MSDTGMATEQPKKFGLLTPANVFLIAALLTAAVIIGIALSQQLKSQPTDGPAPDFAFETFGGEKMRLSDLRGKIVVLNFWAHWCGPCRMEAPDLQAVHEEYADDDVVFLGIAWADNGPKTRAFIQEFGITYMNAPDLGTEIGDLYRVQLVPETFIIDKNGDVAHFFMTTLTEPKLITILDDLLAEEQTAS